MNRTQLSTWMIQESVSKNMERLLDSWDKEIEAAEKASRERAKQVNAEKSAEAQQAARENFQENLLQAEASRLLHYVTGALNHAEANESISVSIPSGVQVASQAVVAPQVGELLEAISDLRAEVFDNDHLDVSQAQYSALWAAANGFAPHPQDIATLLRSHPDCEAWAQRFDDFSVRLESSQKKEKQPTQLQGHLAHREIDTLRSHVQHLQALGPKNLSLLFCAKPSESLGLGSLPKKATVNQPTSAAKSASLQTVLNDFNRPARK